ncbi:hypothetical protein D917_07666, partial [Trichinella nativa]
CCCCCFVEEFAVYLRYSRRLDFFETPDYDYCWELFKSVMDRNCWSYDNEFDWTSKLNQAATPSSSFHLSDAVPNSSKEAEKRRLSSNPQKAEDRMRNFRQSTALLAVLHNDRHHSSAINSNTVDVVDDPGVRSQQPINPQMDSGDCDT